MKKLLFLFFIIGALSCDDNEEPLVYTNNQQEFELLQSSTFPINGTVTILERRDEQVEIRISITGTEGDTQHPAHLHFGDVSAPDAEVALLLTPVLGSTGESITLTNRLNNEQPITYEDLLTFDGHIKVHQDNGPNKNIILASGNIGSAFTKSGNTGRQKIAVCKSE